MVGGDERRMRLIYSLAFALPGTPVLFYGEEIGMAENLGIPGRYSVRAPMQWSAERHGGFSVVDDPDALCRPVVDARGMVARAGQRGGAAPVPDSLLNWMERLIRRRRECPELGWGRCTVLDAGHPAVLAHRADWDGSTILAAALLRRRSARGAAASSSPGSRRSSTCSGTRTCVPAADGTVTSRWTPTGTAGSACAATDSASRRNRLGHGRRPGTGSV